MIHPALSVLFPTIDPPFYIEDDRDEKIQDTHEIQGNLYSSFLDEEQEIRTYEEEGHDIDVALNDGNIVDYCKQFSDFMQAQLHRKYGVLSSRKRSRGQDQNEDASS